MAPASSSSSHPENKLQSSRNVSEKTHGEYISVQLSQDDAEALSGLLDAIKRIREHVEDAPYAQMINSDRNTLMRPHDWNFAGFFDYPDEQYSTYVYQDADHPMYRQRRITKFEEEAQREKERNERPASSDSNRSFSSRAAPKKMSFKEYARRKQEATEGRRPGSASPAEHEGAEANASKPASQAPPSNPAQVDLAASREPINMQKHGEDAKSSQRAAATSSPSLRRRRPEVDGHYPRASQPEPQGASSPPQKRQKSDARVMESSNSRTELGEDRFSLADEPASLSASNLDSMMHTLPPKLGPLKSAWSGFDTPSPSALQKNALKQALSARSSADFKMVMPSLANAAATATSDGRQDALGAAAASQTGLMEDQDSTIVRLKLPHRLQKKVQDILRGSKQAQAANESFAQSARKRKLGEVIEESPGKRLKQPQAKVETPPPPSKKRNLDEPMDESSAQQLKQSKAAAKDASKVTLQKSSKETTTEATSAEKSSNEAPKKLRAGDANHGQIGIARCPDNTAQTSAKKPAAAETNGRMKTADDSKKTMKHGPKKSIGGESNSLSTSTDSPRRETREGGHKASAAGSHAPGARKQDPKTGAEMMEAAGRDLKRKAAEKMKLFNSIKSSGGLLTSIASNSTIKHGLVEKIESLACFVQSFAYLQQYKSALSPTLLNGWQSVLGFAAEIAKQCSQLGFAHLQALALLLEASARQQVICILSKAGLHNPKDNDGDSIFKHVLAVQELTAKAGKLLPQDNLNRRYPAAYRAHVAMPLGESLEPSGIVQIATGLLRDWSDREEVSWDAQAVWRRV